MGLAIADSETKLASPWRIIDNNLEALKKIVLEESIGKIVVGLPLGLAGQASAQLAKAKKFVESLKNNFDVLVETQDERLSTVSANKLMSEQKKRGERDDAVSAMLILQNYLDRK